MYIIVLLFIKLCNVCVYNSVSEVIMLRGIMLRTLDSEVCNWCTN